MVIIAQLLFTVILTVSFLAIEEAKKTKKEFKSFGINTNVILPRVNINLSIFHINQEQVMKLDQSLISSLRSLILIKEEMPYRYFRSGQLIQCRNLMAPSPFPR
jgi:hypothetical protein